MFAMLNLSTIQNREQIPSDNDKYKRIQIALEECHVFIAHFS